VVDDEREERRRKGRREQEARKKKGGVVKGKAVGRLTNYDGDFNNYELFFCIVFLVTVLAGG